MSRSDRRSCASTSSRPPKNEPGPAKTPHVELILPYIPDWDDFAGRFLDSGGSFVVATVGDETAGCVGVTPLGDGVCEMNRLWVRPAFRTIGLGRALAVASMEEARRIGFTRMLLDVLPQRTRADRAVRIAGLLGSPADPRVRLPDGVPRPRSLTRPVA